MEPTIKMTGEQIAVLADDLADMIKYIVQTRDIRTGENMARNIASMIRAQWPKEDATNRTTT